MKPVLLETPWLYLSPEKWGHQFIEYLLQITHKQWNFRKNSGVHYRGLDGLTEAEHDKIFDRVEELMFTDPDYLLPKHRHLLEQDFKALSNRSAIDHQYWIVSMESAILASRCVSEGRAVPAAYHASTPLVDAHTRDPINASRAPSSIATLGADLFMTFIQIIRIKTKRQATSN